MTESLTPRAVGRVTRLLGMLLLGTISPDELAELRAFSLAQLVTATYVARQWAGTPGDAAHGAATATDLQLAAAYVLLHAEPSAEFLLSTQEGAVRKGVVMIGIRNEREVL